MSSLSQATRTVLFHAPVRFIVARVYTLCYSLYMMTTTNRPQTSTSFHCRECGQKFRTARETTPDSFAPEGCPECGGLDISVAAPNETAAERIARVREEAMARS